MKKLILTACLLLAVSAVAQPFYTLQVTNMSTPMLRPVFSNFFIANSNLLNLAVAPSFSAFKLDATNAFHYGPLTLRSNMATGQKGELIAELVTLTGVGSSSISVSNANFGNVYVSNNISGNGAGLTNLTGNDTAYAASWNANTNVPTKNALYDKIETLSAVGPPTFNANQFASLGGTTNISTGALFTNSQNYGQTFFGTSTNASGAVHTGGRFETNFMTGNWNSTSNAISTWGTTGGVSKVIVDGTSGVISGISSGTSTLTPSFGNWTMNGELRLPGVSASSGPYGLGTSGAANTADIQWAKISTGNSSLKTNVSVWGYVLATNGVASLSVVAAVGIAETGWTNLWTTNNALVVFDGTAMTIRKKNNAGTLYYTNAVSHTGVLEVNLQPGGAVIISGTGVFGRATPF